MQSPLTPQRGRIESNPREYTHMECRACDELEVMLAGSRCVAGRPPGSHERGNPDGRAWISGRPRHESGKSDGMGRQKPKNRPIIHSHFPAVRKFTLIRHPYISHLSLVSKARDKEIDER